MDSREGMSPEDEKNRAHLLNARDGRGRARLDSRRGHMTRSVSPEGMSPEGEHFTRSSPQGIPTLCFVLCSLFFEDAQRQTFHEVIPAGDSNFVLCALLFALCSFVNNKLLDPSTLHTR